MTYRTEQDKINRKEANQIVDFIEEENISGYLSNNMDSTQITMGQI